ncbi:MAG: tetratricopeptide repeat protein, partial [Thermoplasmata archaeon]
LPCFDRFIEINPNFIKGWYDRGNALQKLNRKEEARQSFESIVAFAPNDAIVKDADDLCARANAFYELGRHDDALDCFDKILETYPDNHYALEGKGAMLEMLGRNEEALQCYKEAIDLNSNNVSVWYRPGSYGRGEKKFGRRVRSFWTGLRDNRYPLRQGVL